MNCPICNTPLSEVFPVILECKNPDCIMGGATPDKDQWQALALRMTPVIQVNGGCLAAVTDLNGNEIPHHLIDYDFEESGSCPVCHENYGTDENKCAECGYDESKDNALEAVRGLFPNRKE